MRIKLIFNVFKKPVSIGFICIFLSLSLNNLVLAEDNYYRINFPEEEKSGEFKCKKIDGKEYVELSDLQKAFSLDAGLQLVSKKIDLNYRGKKVSFFMDSNEVRIGAQIRQLPAQIKKVEGGYFFPIETITMVLPDLLDKKIVFEKKERVFQVSGKKADIKPQNKIISTTSKVIATKTKGTDEKSNSLILPKDKSGIYTIVLDPGHGGIDSGAIGPSGLKEKDATLDIALRIKKLLTSKLGLRVILTREKDKFVPLRQRAAIANNNKADIFISIHINASHRSYARGIEVYFLAEALDSESRAVAAFENAALRYEEGKNRKASDIEFILWDIVQNEYLESSRILAQVIGEQWKKNLSLRNRGVKSAPFIVLKGSSCPAVLIEMGFITNKQEESNLKKNNIKDNYAKAAFDAILRFKSKYEGRGIKK